VPDQQEVHLHALTSVRLDEGFGDAIAVGLVGDLRRRPREVVLVMGVLDMGQEVPATPDQVESPSKQIPDPSLILWKKEWRNLPS
jgi:hypothetical protein